MNKTETILDERRIRGMTEAIFNTKEAAKFLRISPSTLRARRKEGLIPYYKTKALVGHYRYKKSELIKLQVSDV